VFGCAQTHALLFTVSCVLTCSSAVPLIDVNHSWSIQIPGCIDFVMAVDCSFWAWHIMFHVTCFCLAYVFHFSFILVSTIKLWAQNETRKIWWQRNLMPPISSIISTRFGNKIGLAWYVYLSHLVGGLWGSLWIYP